MIANITNAGAGLIDVKVLDGEGYVFDEFFELEGVLISGGHVDVPALDDLLSPYGVAVADGADLAVVTAGASWRLDVEACERTVDDAHVL